MDGKNGKQNWSGTYTDRFSKVLETKIEKIPILRLALRFELKKKIEKASRNWKSWWGSGSLGQKKSDFIRDCWRKKNVVWYRREWQILRTPSTLSGGGKFNKIGGWGAFWIIVLFYLKILHFLSKFLFLSIFGSNSKFYCQE